jgi:hypothetical protein
MEKAVKTNPGGRTPQLVVETPPHAGSGFDLTAFDSSFHAQLDESYPTVSGRVNKNLSVARGFVAYQSSPLEMIVYSRHAIRATNKAEDCLRQLPAQVNRSEGPYTVACKPERDFIPNDRFHTASPQPCWCRCFTSTGTMLHP